MSERMILVATEGGPAANLALPIGRTIARVLGARLGLVYVTEAALTTAALRERLRLGAAELDDVLVMARVERGPAAAAIVAVAVEHDAELVVMVAHTRPFVRLGLGRVSLGVLLRAPCPVLLVPPRVGGGWKPRRLLLPQDGSPATAQALEPVARFARRTGSAMLVLHVPGAAERPPGTITGPQYLDQPQLEWSAFGKEFLARVRCLGRLPPELGLRLAVATGDPGRAIVDHAHSDAADLVVLPWRGRLESGHGRIFQTVMRGTPCPVLVLRLEP